MRARKSDPTFDLNLAPVLDIMVTVIPMLLLSVAFIQVRMIETPVPQVVAEKLNNQDKPPTVSVNLKVSNQDGFQLIVFDKGKRNDVKVGMKQGKLDFDGLQAAASQIKRQHADIFKLELAPAQTVSFDDIVKTMDSVRRMPASVGKVTITDTKTGQKVETDLMFPDVIFANVVGD